MGLLSIRELLSAAMEFLLYAELKVKVYDFLLIPRIRSVKRKLLLRLSTSFIGRNCLIQLRSFCLFGKRVLHPRKAFLIASSLRKYENIR
jgi:hypothetical protein